MRPEWELFVMLIATRHLAGLFCILATGGEHAVAVSLYGDAEGGAIWGRSCLYCGTPA